MTPRSRLFQIALGAALLVGSALRLGWAQESAPLTVGQLEIALRNLEKMRATTTDPARAQQLGQLYRLLQMTLDSTRRKKATAELSPSSPAQPTPGPETVPPAPSSAENPETVAPPATPTPAETPAPTPIPKEPPVEVGPSPLEPAPPPAIEPPKLPAWLLKGSILGAFGYQENILRGATRELDSASALGELEFSALNTKRDRYRALGYAKVTRTHFLEEPDVRDEDLWLFLGRYEYRLSEDWWLGWRGDYLLSHLPLDDPSLAEPDVNGLPLRLQQFTVGPTLAWEPTESHVLRWEPGYRREDLSKIVGQDYSGNHWLLDLDYEWRTERNLVRLGYEFSYRDYDDREQRLPNGRPIAGSRLTVLTHELTASYRREWHWEERRLRWTGGARYRWEEDNGGGYDDLSRLDLFTRAEFQGEKLKLSLEAGRQDYDYDSRRVSPTSSQRRDRRGWYGRGQATYELRENTNLWLRYEQRDNTGNREFDRYGHRELSIGIQYQF